MSTVAFGALATRREQSASGTSTSEQPPGLSTYVDVVAALVPAEVLAINTVVVTLATKAVPGGGTQPTDAGTLRLAFWLLAGLSVVLYILGRRPSPASGSDATSAEKAPQTPWWHLQRWEPEDVIRMLVPPLAFTGWAMLDPASAWSSVAPGMSGPTRILIGMVGATALGAITKALAIHADLKSPPTGAGVQAENDTASQTGEQSPEKDQTGEQAPEKEQAREQSPEKGQAGEQAEQTPDKEPSLV